MTQLVIRRDEGAITRLEMAAPEKLNALSTAMLEALETHLRALEDQTDQKVIILSGQGRAFCAGHDLGELRALRAQGGTGLQGLFDHCARVMQLIPRLPQPVIAQVHGIATAAGCQLVASCDLAVAEAGTRFGVNGVNIGLFCSTPMVALTRAIPRKAAFEMLVTGQFIDTERAYALGLINQIAPSGELAAQTAALAQSIAAKLGAALRIGKRAFYEQAEMTLAEAYDHTGAVMVTNMGLADTDEGLAAFLEKRPPSWA